MRSDSFLIPSVIAIGSVQLNKYASILKLSASSKASSMVSLLLSLVLLSSSRVHESHIFLSLSAALETAFKIFEVSGIEETVSQRKISTKGFSPSINSS